MQRHPLLRPLRYLLAIDEHRHFTRAAEALHISQSALSQRVRQLEDELGQRLFDRSGKVVQLTDAGVLYLRFARQMQADLQATERAVLDVADLSRGALRLGFTPTFTEYLVEPVISRFHRDHPGIAITLSEMALEQVEAALLADEIDLAFGFVDVRSSDIDVEPLFTERLELVVGPGHPLAGAQTSIGPRQLADIPLVLLTRRYATRFYADEYFQAQAISPRIAIEVNSISAVLKMSQRGELATILPDMIRFEYSGLEYLPLEPPFPVRTAALLRRRGAHRSAASMAFVAQLQAQLAQGDLASLRQQAALRDGTAD